jgi:hypothetical protein
MAWSEAKTGLLIMATITLLAACGPAGVPSQRASILPPSLTVAPTLTLAPERSPVPSSPSPRSATLPPECSPFDPSSMAELLLSAVGDADRNAQAGTNDGAVLAGSVTPGQGWRQPDVAQAVYVAAGAPLTLWATSAEPGVRYCLGTLVIVAAPFSPLGAAPDPAAMVVLDGAPHDGTPKPAFGFHAPGVGGDWVVSLQSQLLDAGVAALGTQTTFFRLEVDRPAPSAPAPVASPRTPCGRPILGDDLTPPATLLAVNGAGARTGQLGVFTWNNAGVQVPGEPLPTTSIALPAGAALSVSVEGHVCATAWRIVYAAIPRDTGRPVSFDPLGVLAEERNAAADPAFASANEIALEPMPRGEWVLRAQLDFADGSTTTYWRIVVP